MDIPTIVLLSIIGLLLYLLFKKEHPKPYPPGPRGLDLVEANIASVNGKLPLQLTEWNRKYGEVVFCPLLVGNTLYLNSPSATRELYMGKHTSKLTNDRMWSYVADLMCRKKCVTFSPATDPDWLKLWKWMHSSLKFYGEGVADFEELVTDRLQTIMTAMEKRCGEDLLMEEETEDFVTTIMATMLTGEPEEVDSELCRTMKWFDAAVRHVVGPSFGIFASASVFLDLIPGYRHQSARRDLLESKKAVLNVLLKPERRATKKPGARKGIVDALLEYQTNEGADWMTIDHVKGLVMDIMAGGINALSQTINAVVFHLLHHADAVRRIQEELDRVVGPERKPGLNDRLSCPYTEACILESMRSAPLLPLGLDHLVTQDLYFRGWLIPKGTVAFTTAYAYNQSPTLWSEPHRFKPERFLDEEGNLLPPSHPTRQSLLTFGTGMRACVAEKFARARIFLYISWLLHSFDILPPGKEAFLPLNVNAWKEGVVACSHLKPYHVSLQKRAG